jgi:hypothetical protein
MFQFPRFPPLVLCVQTRVTPHDGCRVSPFGYLRIGARSTAPRSFSQSPTSFIGSRRQGIHRWLFVAWKSKMLVLAMEFSRCAVSGSTAPAAARPSHCWGAVCRVTPQTSGTGPSKGPTRKRCDPEGSQRSRAGCPFKTEQKDRTFGWARSEETAPSTAVRPGVRVVSGQLGAPWNETPKGSR